MNAKSVVISVNDVNHDVTPGAVRGREIISLAQVSNGEQVLLEVKDDVDIPLANHDIIFIRGGEIFSIGDGSPHVDDNPLLRAPVPFTMNDQPVPEQLRTRHAKLTGRELKAMAGSTDSDLWVDLDRIADELIADEERVVVQAVDHYFTVEHCHEDRFYEVTVLLDGDARKHRFAAKLTVARAIRRCLPKRDRDNVKDFTMTDTTIGTGALDHAKTLREVGVRDGHVLSIVKKNGGGG